MNTERECMNLGIIMRTSIRAYGVAWPMASLALRHQRTAFEGVDSFPLEYDVACVS